MLPRTRFSNLADGVPGSQRRRRPQPALRALLCAFLLAGVAGCQTTPVAPAETTAAQRSALNSMGFVETDGGWMLDISTRILFDVDRDELTPAMRVKIAEMAQELQRIGVRKIRVEGHTDNVGPRSYNMELSARRAEVVAQEFVHNGFSDAMVLRRGWAFDYPAASNATAEGRALNRRVTIVVAPEDPASN